MFDSSFVFAQRSIRPLVLRDTKQKVAWAYAHSGLSFHVAVRLGDCCFQDKGTGSASSHPGASTRHLDNPYAGAILRPVHSSADNVPQEGVTATAQLRTLTQATRLYETILSTTADFAYVFDPEGHFLYANPRLLKVWAKTLDEVVGKTCYDLGYPTWHADMHMREIREIVRTKQPIRGEVPFTGDSGIFGVYDYLFQPVLDSANNVEFIVGTTRDVTARKHAEQKLETALNEKSESERRYRFLANSLPQIAWTAKPDGNLDYYNQRWFDYAGTNPEEMEKVGWTHFVHPDDLPHAGKVWQRSLDTGCNYEVEFRLIRASDQTYRWHLVRAFPMKNEKGDVLQWIGTCTDIDDQRQLQAKLGEALAQAEFLAGLTHKLSTVSNPSELNRIAVQEIGQYLKVHRCYFFSAHPDIHHVRTWRDWCRDDSPEVEGIYTLGEFGEPEWWAAVQAGTVTVDDVRTHPLTKNFLPNYEAIKIAAFSLTPFSHEGRWKACLTVTSDTPRVWTVDEKSLLESAVARVWPLLERAQIEESLRKSEESLSRIAAVVEFSDDAIISMSLEGIIMSWNGGAEQIFGYAAHEIIGKSILTLIPPELQKEEPGIIDKLKRGERIEHHENVRVAKGGRRVDVSLTVSPIKDSNGKVIGASKIARDITEEKRRNEALRENEARFRSELERLVAKRTASLQEAVSQMEEFSYSVSHDLRAPLRAMQGYATALLEDYGEKIDEEGRQYLRHIVSAGNRMDRLTHDVLVYSRIPRTAFSGDAVDLDKLVSDIVQQHFPNQAKDASITIEQSLMPVLGNESFLAQSVSNLIDNAVKFTSKDRPLRVRIWTEAHGQEIRLWVEDNGIGILPEHQARVWGLFERIHPQNMYEGTGIGLAIVRKTVERMHGTIGLESDGATGSRFWIQLPRA
jgi:PAS domain S-box-containing protein